jgi:tetratricopeptide (TPR) repeat protein
MFSREDQMLFVIQPVVWGALLAVVLSVLVLMLTLLSRLRRKNSPLPPVMAAIVRLWPLATGIVVMACLMVIALFAVSAATLVVNQTPVTCSAQAGGPPAQRPKALVTAEDFLAQGAYDFDRGDCDAAITAFSRAIELKPNYAEAYNNRAYTYMIKQQYALALPDLDRAIQIRPDYINALMNRGDIYNYYYVIDYDRAIADYDRVLSLGAQHTSVCGHRMLAQHHGWDPGVVMDIVLSGGGEPGCQQAGPGF